MHISAAVRRNSVCGPGSGEIVAQSDDNISRTDYGPIKEIMTVVEPNGRDAFARQRSTLIARGAHRRIIAAAAAAVFGEELLLRIAQRRRQLVISTVVGITS